MTALLAILGPTASGKSALALRLAERLGGSVLSVDSMQVYRGMDIGTAKPTASERARIPHHMIDLVEPEDEYTVAEFQTEARAVLERSSAPVVVAGGSGLHFRAVVDPMTFPPHDPGLREALEEEDPEALRRELEAADPAAAGAVDLDNPRRVVRAVEVLRLTGETPTGRAGTDEARAVATYRPLLPFRAFGLDPGDELAARARSRFRRMLDAGLVEEVRRLAPRLGRTAAQAVGYKELLGFVRGPTGLEEAVEEAVSATVSLGRRQRTWFRRDPRIEWLPWDEDPDRLVDRVLGAVERAATDREASWSS